MKKSRRISRIVTFAYLILWGCSAAVVHPSELIHEIDTRRKNVMTHPTVLACSISFAPGMLWVDWQEGEEAFNCAGYRGIFFATPFGTKLVWKRMSWIS